MFSRPHGPSRTLGLCPGLCPTSPTLSLLPSPVCKQDLLDPHTPQTCKFKGACGLASSQRKLQALWTHSPKSLYSTAGPPNPAPSSPHSQVFPQSL